MNTATTETAPNEVGTTALFEVVFPDTENESGEGDTYTIRIKGDRAEVSMPVGALSRLLSLVNDGAYYNARKVLSCANSDLLTEFGDAMEEIAEYAAKVANL